MVVTRSTISFDEEMMYCCNSAFCDARNAMMGESLLPRADWFGCVDAAFLPVAVESSSSLLLLFPVAVPLFVDMIVL